MNSEPFYDVKKTPFVDRESFNSAILLLSMVKSSYYYIVGFSRPDNVIEIAFDFSSELHKQITETVRIEFSKSAEYILLRSELKSITLDIYKEDIANAMVKKGSVISSNDVVIYELQIPKHSVIPSSVTQLNSFVLLAKSEICDFVEKCFEYHLGE